MDALKELRVSYQESPLAVDEQHPVFSWRMESDRHGARQEAWRITVRRGEKLCWDSGRVPGPECGEIAYPEMLEPEAAYTWSLSVWNEQGEELRAESAFAAGFLNPAWRRKPCPSSGSASRCGSKRAARGPAWFSALRIPGCFPPFTTII